MVDTRKPLTSCDMTVDEQTKLTLLEQDISAIQQAFTALIDSGRLKVDASGVELSADLVNVENIKLQDIAGDGVNPASEDTLADIDSSIGTSNTRLLSIANALTTGLRFVAETGTPAAVSDGDPVGMWLDEYGRQVIAGYNSGLNALQVNEVASYMATEVEATLLDAVTATGASSTQDASSVLHHTFVVTASSVSTGGTVDFQVSLDGTTWVTVDSDAITGNGSTLTQLEGRFKYIRANLSARTDGTYTVKYYGGN